MYQKITISGRVCTGKTELFTNLSKFLGWETFSVGSYFRNYAKLHKLSLEEAKEQDYKLTRRVDFGIQKKLKSKKNLIVEGWMAGIMGNSIPDVLKVFLFCDDKVRVERFANREKVTKTEAKRKIEEREKNLFEKLEKIYQRNDFTKIENYDLIINTTHLTPNTILTLVTSLITSK